LEYGRYYDYKMDVTKKVLLVEKCVFDIEEKKNMGESCICPYIVENG
jgi:hypothetical protein